MLHSLDRQKKILENLSFDHVTSIHYLCRKTQFNESTIRRDIKLLEQEKKVIIVRGGVIPIKVNEITPLFIENLKEKQSIAQYAANLINEKEKIIINGGTTCSLIPDYIEQKNITVLTNSFTVATKLINKNITDVIIPGGRIYSHNSLILSPFNFDTIKHFHASKFFLSCRSLKDVGLLEDDENLVKFVTSILRISDEIILLIDNSKFYKNDGSFIICPLDKIDTVITDQSIAKLDFLKKYNFRTVITRN